MTREQALQLNLAVYSFGRTNGVARQLYRATLESDGRIVHQFDENIGTTPMLFLAAGPRRKRSETVKQVREYTLGTQTLLNISTRVLLPNIN